MTKNNFEKEITKLGFYPAIIEKNYIKVYFDWIRQISGNEGIRRTDGRCEFFGNRNSILDQLKNYHNICNFQILPSNKIKNK